MISVGWIMTQYVTFDIPVKQDYLRLIQTFQSNFGDGPWIAGGSIRKLFLGLPLEYSDIDIFVNENMRDSFFKKHSQFKNNKKISVNVDGSCWSIKLTPIQYTVDVTIVKMKTVYELLDDFDYTIAQFATDGHKIITTEQSIIDSRNKILRWNNSTNHGGRKVARLRKYCNNGFTPLPGIIPKILGKQPDGSVKYVADKNDY